MPTKSPGMPINVNGPLPRKYREWIRHFVDGDGECLCAEYCHLMKKHYPELTIVEGYYNSQCDTHAWCETPNDLIVDPTIAQFTTSPDPSGFYALAHRTESLRSCPHCGSPIYIDWVTHCTPFCYDRKFDIGETAVGTRDGRLVVAGNIVDFKQTYSRSEKKVVESVKIECHDTIHRPGQIVAVRQDRITLEHWTGTQRSPHEPPLQDLYRPQV
jgi:hypothetical protein